MTELSGWGRFPRLEAEITRIRTPEMVAEALASGPLIARGNGRSYGDSAVGAPRTLDMRGFDRMIRFADGVLEAEAGVLLADIIESFLPRGWFPYVTPGTRFVTLGGAIAADVHGKNHHLEGSFCDYVDWVDVMAPDGRISRLENGTDAFDWLRGGMGLTGVILRAQLRLRPVESGWIVEESVAAPNLNAAIEGFEARLDTPFAVAWIDGLAKGPQLGRSLLLFGHHASHDDLSLALKDRPLHPPPRLQRSLPFTLPGFALNRASVSAFNALYWARGRRRQGQRLVDWERYFYPLDALRNWTGIYGPKGFLQFQCMLPLDAARDGLSAILSRTADAGQASFLSVLKRMGPQAGRFSFPAEGYTLALDFPANERSLRLMRNLDRITQDHGGWMYLAKDARMTAETFQATEPRAAAFAAYRKTEGFDAAFTSAQSQRLGL